MCRLFGFLSGRPSQVEEYLVKGDRSLLAQSHASATRAQRDGWGIAWYDGARSTRIEKGIGGAFAPKERGRFLAAAGAAHGPTVVAHIRNASNPMHLPAGQLIAMENSQPFSAKGVLFAHNGEIPLPRETRALLGEFDSNIRGVNDSEVLFWLLNRQLAESGDPLRAYTRTKQTLNGVWEGHRRRPKFPYSGLNVIFTRGRNELWAFCSWLGEYGTGLLATDRPFYEMGFQRTADSIVVGSEPFTSTDVDWRPLRNGEYLVAHRDHDRVRFETGTIP
jgi:predicted glutamine amidotransferase